MNVRLKSILLFCALFLGVAFSADQFLSYKRKIQLVAESGDLVVKRKKNQGRVPSSISSKSRDISQSRPHRSGRTLPQSIIPQESREDSLPVETGADQFLQPKSTVFRGIGRVVRPQSQTRRIPGEVNRKSKNQSDSSNENLNSAVNVDSDFVSPTRVTETWKNDGPKKNNNKRVTINRISVLEGKLVIQGTNVDEITDVEITGHGVYTHVSKLSATSSEYIAMALSGIGFVVGKVYDLIISDAYAETTYPIEIELLDGSVGAEKLAPLGAAQDGYVLKWNHSAGEWVPAPDDGGGSSGGGGSGTVTQIDLGVGMSGNGTSITGTGSVAVDVGTNANQIPQFNASKELVLNSDNILIFRNSSGNKEYEFKMLTDVLQLRNIIDNKTIFEASGDAFLIGGQNVCLSDGTNCPSFSSSASATSSFTVAHDVSNKTVVNVAPTGFTTINSSGTGAGFNFTGGNVGIGTSAPPIDTLQVESSSTAVLGINTTGNTATDRAILAFDRGGAQQWDLGVNTNNSNSNKFFFRRTATSNYVMTLDESGKVGIGTVNPDANLTISGSAPEIRMKDTGTNYSTFRFYTAGFERGAFRIDHSSNFRLDTAGVERLRVDATGKVGIGTIAPASILDIVQDSGAAAVTIKAKNSVTDLNIYSHFNGSAGASFRSFRSRGTSTIPSAVADNDQLLNLRGFGHDGSGFVEAARINLKADATPTGPGDLPGKIEFSTREPAGLLKERMRITSSGNVGIGTNIPSFKLQIAENISNDYSTGITTKDNGVPEGTLLHLKDISGSTVANKFVGIGFSGVGPGGATRSAHIGALPANLGHQMELVFGQKTSNTSFVERMRINQAGNVGIGTSAPAYKLQVGEPADGSEARANAWNLLSDERLKKNFQPIPNALDKVLAVNGYFYEWNKGPDKTRKMGVKAQELEKVFPEVVSKGSDGFLSVSYDHLIAPVIEAIKSLHGKILALFERAASTENKLAEITKRIEVLEDQGKAQRTPAGSEEGEIQKLKSENEALKNYLCLKDRSAPFCKDR